MAQRVFLVQLATAGVQRLRELLMSAGAMMGPR